MDTAVVKFDPLPDPVGAAAQDHHAFFPRGLLPAGAGFCAGGAFPRGVGGIIVGGLLFDTADGNLLPCFGYTQGAALGPEFSFFRIQETGKVAVTESVPFGPGQ